MRRGFDTPLMFGAVTRRSTQDKYPYNTALMMDAAGDATGKYDKVFLMMFGEYIPFYDSIPWFTKLFPEASNFSRGSEPASFPLQVARPRLQAGPAHLLRGHPARVRAPGGAARSQRFRQHHQRRLVRPHRRAVPAPGAGGVPLGRAPAGDGPRREHRRLRAHRRRRPRAETRPNRSTRRSCRRPRRRRCWSTWRCSRAAALYRHVGDLFGLACLGALVVFLVRSRRRRPRT